MQKPHGRFLRRHRLIAVAMLLVLPWLGGTASAANHVAWVTGQAFRQRLAQPVDILWSGNPLREAIASLSHAQKVAILIDRRVDPGQKLELTIKNEPMDTALHAIAEKYSLGVAQLGPVVYIGPPAAADRLEPAAAAFQKAIERLPKATHRKFSTPKALDWDDLATPRELLEQLAEQADVELTGLERVPHDLWAAADLPPLPLVDRMTLVAFQFDLTFAVSSGGAKLELVPLPDDLPAAPEKHKAASESRPAAKPTPATSSAAIDRVRIQRMSVQSEPLGRVLRQLAERLGLELKFDEQAIQHAGISLDQPVSATVENATIDDLLRELLKSTGLTFQRRQKIVEIRPN